jgi:uncharacterized membrane protein YccC
MYEMILKNMHYLRSVINYKTDNLKSQLDYRLARKEMYVSTSNLGSAFQRMLNEPKRKQQNVNDVNKFILLNNLFSSNIASLSYLMKQENTQFSDKEIREIRKSINSMKESYTIFTEVLNELDFNINLKISTEVNSQQIELCHNLMQISSEIKKLSTKIIQED